MDTFQRMQKLSSCNIKNIDDSVYGSAGQVFSIRTLLRRDGWFETIQLTCPFCTQAILLVSVLTSCQQSPAIVSNLVGMAGSGQSITAKDPTVSFSYICNTEDEFSSSVQRIFFFPTFHTKNVHFPHVRSGGQILGVRGEGQSPGVHWKGSKEECLVRKNSR